MCPRNIVQNQFEQNICSTLLIGCTISNSVLGALINDYKLNRQHAVEVLKTCIQMHADTPDTPNW